MATKQVDVQDKNGARRTTPRQWSGNLFSNKGPIVRFFKMEREARKLATEGLRLKSSGSLQGASLKFQLAASKEKDPGFRADLHEVAADTMVEMAGIYLEVFKKNPCLLEAAEEYRCAALKRIELEDKEKAARLYSLAGNLSRQAGAPNLAKNDFQSAYELTSKQSLRTWLRAQMAAN